jgi:pimeloyl-ACP methyl ester carboxylesterase
MIAVDRPGFGQSESGREVKSLKRQAALLKPILDRNRSGSGTILVGHSFGGPVISRMAMDYSDQVGALIMISPTIDPELENTSWYQHLVKVPLFKILIPKNLITANQEILPLKGELEKCLHIGTRSMSRYICFTVNAIVWSLLRMLVSLNACWSMRNLRFISCPNSIITYPGRVQI